MRNSLVQGPNRVSLAEVQLLTDVAVNANLTEQPDNYDLALNLTGVGLADAEVLNPDRVAVFNIPDLAGKMQANGSASVSVELLPITLEDLPTLKGQLDPLTGTVADTVTDLLAGIDRLQRTPVVGSLLRVEGLTELTDALDNLQNLDTALSDLLDYEGSAPVTINPDGSIVINFSDGLGQHLDTVTKQVVQDALTDLVNAITNLKLSGIAGNLIDPVLNPVKALLPGVNNVLTAVTNDTVNLSNELAGVQVLGPTSVSANVIVDKPAGVAQDEVVVTGSVVNTSAIDAQLLADLDGQDTIIFDEEADGDADADADADAR